MSRYLKLAGLTTATFASTQLKPQKKTNSWFWSSKDEFEKLSKSDWDLFLWGEGHYQAKPGSSMAFPNFKPKLLKGALKRGNVENYSNKMIAYKKSGLKADLEKKIYAVPDLIDIESGRGGVRLGIDLEGRLWSFESEIMHNIRKRGKNQFIYRSNDTGKQLFYISNQSPRISEIVTNRNLFNNYFIFIIINKIQKIYLSLFF